MIEDTAWAMTRDTSLVRPEAKSQAIRKEKWLALGEGERLAMTKATVKAVKSVMTKAIAKGRTWGRVKGEKLAIAKVKQQVTKKGGGMEIALAGTLIIGAPSITGAVMIVRTLDQKSEPDRYRPLASPGGMLYLAVSHSNKKQR